MRRKVRRGSRERKNKQKAKNWTKLRTEGNEDTREVVRNGKGRRQRE